MRASVACILIQDGIKESDLPPALTALMSDDKPLPYQFSCRVGSVTIQRTADLQPAWFVAAVESTGRLGAVLDLLEFDNTLTDFLTGGGKLEPLLDRAKEIIVEAEEMRYAWGGDLN